MVTKQQQIERMAHKIHKWNGAHKYAEFMTNQHIGITVYRFTDMPSDDNAFITRQEWQQERDRISSKPEADSAWHERGELPPVGVPVELWFGGSFAYNCEFIGMRGYNYVLWNLDDDKPDCADSMNSQFRPPHTERENAIEDMSRVMHEHDSVINDVTLGALYDAGYRKVKP